jgi:glycerophosphoryl diester phosphodiesterase
MLLDLPIPAVFAHRGVSAKAPENTLAAFQLALNQNVDGIELDVHLSADGQVVVIHNSKIDQTTNGKGAVRKSSFQNLRKFDAGSWFSPEFAGERIPSLSEVLILVEDKLITNIELKSSGFPGDRLPKKVSEVVKHHRLEKKIIFSSFSPWALLRIKKLLPEVPIGLLILPGLLGTIVRIIFGGSKKYYSIHPHISSVTPKMLRQVKLKGKKVIAYAVNESKDIRRLFAEGIDGIITDNPELGMKIRSELI